MVVVQFRGGLERRPSVVASKGDRRWGLPLYKQISHIKLNYLQFDLGL